MIIRFYFSGMKDMELTPCNKDGQEKISVWLMDCYILALVNALISKCFCMYIIDVNGILFLYQKRLLLRTFQKWVAKLQGFAIINAWQHLGKRKSASHKK